MRGTSCVSGASCGRVRPNIATSTLPVTGAYGPCGRDLPRRLRRVARRSLCPSPPLAIGGRLPPSPCSPPHDATHRSLLSRRTRGATKAEAHASRERPRVVHGAAGSTVRVAEEERPAALEKHGARVVDVASPEPRYPAVQDHRGALEELEDAAVVDGPARLRRRRPGGTSDRARRSARPASRLLTADSAPKLALECALAFLLGDTAITVGANDPRLRGHAPDTRKSWRAGGTMAPQGGEPARGCAHPPP